MKIKIKQLIAWIGGKDRHELGVDDHLPPAYGEGDPLIQPLPVSILGFLTQTSDDHYPVVYGQDKKPKNAYPHHIEVTSFSVEPFPLKMLLEMIHRAAVIHEDSRMLHHASDQRYPESVYGISREDAARDAVQDVLGSEDEPLAQFVYLASHLQADLFDLRMSLKGTPREPVED